MSAVATRSRKRLRVVGLVEVEHDAALGRVVVPPPEAALGARLVVDERPVRARPGDRRAARRRSRRRRGRRAACRERRVLARELDDPHAGQRRVEPSVTIRSPPRRAAASISSSSARAPRRTPRRCARRGTARRASISQSVADRCTGRPSTRTSPISGWCTTRPQPPRRVAGSWSMRSSGVATDGAGTPAACSGDGDVEAVAASRPRRELRRRARPAREPAGERREPRRRPPTARR